MTSDPSRALDDEVAGCAAAHQRLLATLDEAAAAAAIGPSAPSLLPDWTIGHVLTHVARNADAFRHMIEGAAVGETRLMYPSAQHRDDDINRGAGRALEVLVGDVRNSIWALESSWARLSSVGWSGHGLTRIGKVPVTSIPWRRWREVELHHADLGLGFTTADWSPAFIAQDLARRLEEWTSEPNTLPAEVGSAQPWQQLAWLLGRPSGLSTPSPGWG